VFTLYDRKRRKTFRREYVTIGYFELCKRNVETESQRQWRRFFVTGDAGADAPDYIRKAAGVVEVANMSEEERKMMDRREYEIADHQSVMWGAEMRGEARGEARGKAVGEAIGEARGSKEKAMDIVRNLLDMGLPLEKITKATGIPIEEIEQLRTGGGR
jgi:predicted transposase/invertase (TIGR01784 family)